MSPLMNNHNTNYFEFLKGKIVIPSDLLLSPYPYQMVPALMEDQLSAMISRRWNSTWNYWESGWHYTDMTVREVATHPFDDRNDK